MCVVFREYGKIGKSFWVGKFVALWQAKSYGGQEPEGRPALVIHEQAELAVHL